MHMFRHFNQEEFLCVQMVKLHLLCRIAPSTVKYWMNKSPIRQFSLTIYEAELFDHINIFHSKGILANNNQLDYSRLEFASLTPFTSFLKLYQLICSTPQFINTNHFWTSSQSSSPSSSYNKAIQGIYK
jgi:hypothetical protein